MIGWCIRTTLLMAIGELCNILKYEVCMLEWSKNGSLKNPSDQLTCFRMAGEEKFGYFGLCEGIEG